MTFRRRDLLLTGLSAAAAASWPQASWAQAAWSAPDFLNVSARLTGFPVAQLNPGVGAALLKTLQARGSLPALNTLSPNSALSKEIVATWYSGIAHTAAGPVVLTHEDALMWRCADFMHPPGQCGGAFGYWAEPPASHAAVKQPARKSAQANPTQEVATS